MLSQVMIGAFTYHLWNIPWSVVDARRSVQNILNPNREQENLKSIREMVYHERTYIAVKLVSFPKKPVLQDGFFHIWRIDYPLNSLIAIRKN